ncbi:MAG TPA: RNA polymerase sigma factor [Acidobacteria bacterium]|nr:RNA polymerase sigma factor [Acidobacteriota bacterium]
MDEELAQQMGRYQMGELAAFERLYALLAPRLRQYLSSLTFDAGLAEDLLQEAFLQIHRARHTYQPPHPVVPWAFAIARNVYRMDRRAAGRRRRYEEPAPGEVPELPIPAEADGLADRQAVRRALLKVPEDGREPLLLHHVWGLSFGEIGAVLGIRGGAAKVRAHRAMNALRRLLGAREG